MLTKFLENLYVKFTFWRAKRKYVPGRDYLFAYNQFTVELGNDYNNLFPVTIIRGKYAGKIVAFSDINITQDGNVSYTVQVYTPDKNNVDENFDTGSKEFEKFSGDLLSSILNFVLKNTNDSIESSVTRDADTSVIGDDLDNAEHDTIEVDSIKPRKKRTVRKKGAAVSEKVVSGSKSRKKASRRTKKLPD